MIRLLSITLAFLLIATAFGSRQTQAPARLSQVAEMRHDLRALRNEAMADQAKLEGNLRKIIVLIEEQCRLVQKLSFKTESSTEACVASFAILPIALEMAEELAVATGEYWETAYRLSVARRTLTRTWGSNPPDENSSLDHYRRWATALQSALPDLVRDVARARKALDETASAVVTELLPSQLRMVFNASTLAGLKLNRAVRPGCVADPWGIRRGSLVI